MNLRVCIAALLSCAACQPVAPPSNAHLSAVDYWPESHLLFVAAQKSGVVDVLRVPENPRQGSFDFVERLAEPGRREIVRIAVDRVNRRLWVADPGGVSVYPLAPRGPATRIPHGPPLTPLLTDLVIDAEGNGYLFMGGGERIDRVDATTLRADPWLTVGHPGPRTSRSIAARALVAKDGHHVIFRPPGENVLVSVDLATREMAKIERRDIDAFDCAALLWNRADSIVAIPCRGDSVGEIPLGDDGRPRSASSPGDSIGASADPG
jgi:hypothetical protein